MTDTPTAPTTTAEPHTAPTQPTPTDLLGGGWCEACYLTIGSPTHPDSTCPYICSRCNNWYPIILNTLHSGGLLHGATTRLCIPCHKTARTPNPPRPDNPFASDITAIPTLSIFPSSHSDSAHLPESSSSLPPSTAPAAASPSAHWDSLQPPWWLCPDLPLRLYADAVLREYATWITADLRDVDEASRVGCEVMTVTETSTPERPPRGGRRVRFLDETDYPTEPDPLTPDPSPEL